MTDILINAHSGWRYIVLLSLLVTALYYLYSYVTKRSLGQDRAIDLAFTTSIHVQVTLGLILMVVFFIDGLFYARLWGHVITMLLLLPLAIVYSRLARTWAADPPRKRLLGLAAPVVTLLLIIGGLQAIQRGLIG